MLGVLCDLSNGCILLVVTGETGTEHSPELTEKGHTVSGCDFFHVYWLFWEVGGRADKKLQKTSLLDERSEKIDDLA